MRHVFGRCARAQQRQEKCERSNASGRGGRISCAASIKATARAACHTAPATGRRATTWVSATPSAIVGELLLGRSQRLVHHGGPVDRAGRHRSRGGSHEAYGVGVRRANAWTRPDARRIIERGEQLRNALPPRGRLLLDAPRDDAGEAVRHVGAELADVGQVFVLLMVEHRVEALPCPGPCAREHLPRDQPEAVDIAAAVELDAVDLLGRHVRRRADRDASHRELRLASHGAGEAEVGEEGAAVRLDEDVAGLHVAMHDAHRVRGVERLRHVAEDGLGALG